ncbi:MAG: hypothetical protein WCK54_21325 [Desulfuromonadales bacterium]
MGPAGGSVTLALTNGTVFQFDVPAGALPTATTLSLSSRQPSSGQRFNLLLQPAGLLLANGAKGTLTIALPPGQTLPATGGLVYDGVLIPFSKLLDGHLQVSLSEFAGAAVAKSTARMISDLLFKEVALSPPGNACGNAPSLSNSNGGLTAVDAIEIELYGQCMVSTVQALAANEQFAEAVRVANAVAAYLQRTGSGNATQLITQASSISCTAYGLALDRGRTTTVTSMGILYNLIKPILFWETTVQQLGTSCSGWPTDEYQTVINAKTAEAEAYYKLLKPNLTDTSSSNYTAAKTEAGQSAQAKNEVLALNPPPAVRSTVTNDVLQRAQPVLLDAMLQAPWNSCNSLTADYTELMNLMVTLNSPDSVKDAAQYCGTMLQAQTKNLAGTVIDTLVPNLGGVSAGQKRAGGSIKATKNAKLVLNGPIQAMKCPAGSASGETLTIKLDGTTLRSGLTAPYLSSPLEIDIAAALQTAHPNATTTLTQAVLVLERTGSTCGDFWGINPVPLLSLTLTFTERKIVYDIAYSGSNPLIGNEIFSINADGSGNTRLTSDPMVSLPDGEGGSALTRVNSGSFPSLSPDGSRIAFVKNHFISLMNADGGGITPLTSLQIGLNGDSSPAWSPDGTRIAFVRHETGGVYKIYVINAGGGATTLIYNFASSFDSGPAWSPDGTKLVFAGYTDSSNVNYGIFVKNADGTGAATQVISDMTYNDVTSSSAWSPDGRKIIFAGTYGIWVMNADGSNPQQIGNNLGGTGTNPSWSPDGARITFAMHDGTAYQLYVMNANGSNISKITNNDAFSWAFHPAWR